ncbi:MAG TPA: GYF domain-containing protein [Pirellulales bacterium]|nr:GYF domain-containing protein [Pirellulales bacterium]
MGNRWYVALDGEELGPLSDTGLERMIQGGRIEGDTLVRNGLGGEWTAAREVESELAARPSRQRPGQAAIEAALKAKQPPRPPAPAAKIPAALLARPPAAPPADTLPASDVTANPLPAPDDLPLPEAPPDAAAKTPTPALETHAVAPPATPHRSPIILVATGAGAVLILAVSFFAGWFALRSLTSGAAPAPIASPAAIDPAIAALQQQAEQLRRDLAEAKEKLESQPQPPETPSPKEQTPPAAPQAAEKNEPPAASDPSATNDPGAKPAADEPGAEAMAEPSAVKLEADRTTLAVMIANERVVDDARKKFRQSAAKFESTLEFNFEPQYEFEFARRFLEAEAEVASLDGDQLAAKQQAAEARREVRRKEAARLLAEAREAVEPLELRSAVLKAWESAILMTYEDSGTPIGEFAAELVNALPSSVFAALNKMPDARLQSLIGVEQLPSDWPDRATDPLIAEAMRKSFVRLVPLTYGFRRVNDLLGQLKEARTSTDLVKLRTLFLLYAANVANDDGEITTAEILPLIDIYGVCRVDDPSPLIDGVLSNHNVEQANSSKRGEFLFGLVQGKIKLETYRDIYEKARKAAGDAWPPDDRPHPLAGRWKGKENWEIEIDPRRDRIVFRRSSPEATFEQRICKIGADHLVAYEKRKVPIERVATDPFRTEKYDSDDRFPGPDDARPDEAIAFTCYSQSKGGTVLQIRRRIHSADWAEKSGGEALWEIIGNPKEYREFRAVYRRVKE